jgi:hypothetical protein
VSGREITPAGWEELCQRFTEAHRGERITIESMTPGGGTIVARDLPLERMEFDPSGGCSSHLRIYAGEGAGKCVHSIVEPFHLVYLENERGGKSFRIEAESGHFLLHFASGKMDQVLGD